jgi:hypothetical protein
MRECVAYGTQGEADSEANPTYQTISAHSWIMISHIEYVMFR